MRDQVVARSDHTPKAVLIIGAHTNLPAEEIDAFQREMKADLQRCGLTAEAFAPDPLTLEPEKEHDRLVALRKSIEADLVISYHETSSTAGHPRVADFDAVASDAQNMALWRGHFFMPEWDWMRPTADPGEDVARDFVRHLAHAGLLGSCQPARS